jgi:hypothetical protein
MFRHRWLIALAAIAVALVPVIADAHARAGDGFSGGSRGMRTFSAPPTIPTAPTAAPIQNSMTQPGSAAPIGQTESMVERASGRTVEGGERSEVAELWTFMRARAGNWLLSAIQQT